MNVAQILLREPALVAIWMILLLLTGPALVVLATPDGVRRPRQALRHTAEALREHRQQRERSRQQAAEAERYAEELTTAAARARTGAQRWHEHWQKAQQELDSAWQAWRDAETRLARSRAAAAFPMPPAASTPEDDGDRERFLARLVLAAARRGELPMPVVADALAGRDGWDPHLHPAELELRVHRASAEHLAARYRRAAAAERVAWHDAQLAAATRDSLRAESAAATAGSTADGRQRSHTGAPQPAPARSAVVARAA